MQFRAAIAMVLAAGSMSCGGSAAQIEWGEGGTDPSEAGAASSSSGQPSGMAGSGVGSGNTSSTPTSGNGSVPGSGTGSGSSSSAGSSTTGTGTSTGSSNSPDAATADATTGNGGSSANEGGVADASSQGAGDGGDPLAAARGQCVQIINQYRATLSPPSPPLQEATAQESCVDGQAKADYTANTAHSAFGVCRERAQDECPNWPGMPSAILTGCLAQMWAEGPPPPGTDNHWLNMSNAKYTKVACGFYQTPRGSWWATQDFW
jgi:hypothetical protein